MLVEFRTCLNRPVAQIIFLVYSTSIEQKAIACEKKMCSWRWGPSAINNRLHKLAGSSAKRWCYEVILVVTQRGNAVVLGSIQS